MQNINVCATFYFKMYCSKFFHKFGQKQISQTLTARNIYNT